MKSLIRRGASIWGKIKIVRSPDLQIKASNSDRLNLEKTKIKLRPANSDRIKFRAARWLQRTLTPADR